MPAQAQSSANPPGNPDTKFTPVRKPVVPPANSSGNQGYPVPPSWAGGGLRPTTFPPNYGSPGLGTSGGLMTGGGPTIGTGGPFLIPQNFMGRQNIPPGWAGYLQWLRARRQPPQQIMPGGVPGPVRG